ncbi:MAG: SLC13 family permease [Gemmatimonadales bacterium]|nr:MAG: SLC13 family permease [Gemmatimonadales bacterium]
MALVYGILVATIALFVSEWLRLDVVALLALLALSLTGILSPAQALAGFADPVVLMIAALFVVGDGLFQTGVAQAMGRLPGKLAGDSQIKLLVIIMILVAILSGFMSSTGTVAVMLPVVMGLAWARDMSPSKLLIPLSVASLLGGMLTLIGTAPNIVVSNHLAAMGRDPFGFFAFTPIGAAMVVVGIAFMALFGRKLLPDRPSPGRPERAEDQLSVAEMAGSWDLLPRLFRLRITPGSPMAGRSLAELELPEAFGVTVLEVLEAEGEEEGPSEGGTGKRGQGKRGQRKRGERERRLRAPRGRPKEDRTRLREALADTELQSGQLLLVEGSADGVARMVGRDWVVLLDEPTEGDPTAREAGIAEVLLTPRSRLLGRTLKETRFRDRYQLSVVGIQRLGESLEGDIREAKLRFGDMLLVQGPWEKIRLIQGETRDFVVAMAPREMGAALRPLDKAPLALSIMAGMMLLLTFEIVPAVTAVLLAAVAMVLFRCVSVDDAYRAVNWESVVLIAGILPMATALEITGGMDLIVAALDGILRDATPLVLLGALFLLTSVLSQVISNTATAVLLAPIAFQLAISAGAAPEPFMMTIAVAASTAFATPVASPVNTLVLGPGGYRFGDFFKVGVALQFLILLATLALVPVFFPF